MHELLQGNYPQGGELRSSPFSDPVPKRKEGGVPHFFARNAFGREFNTYNMDELCIDIKLRIRQDDPWTAADTNNTCYNSMLYAGGVGVPVGEVFNPLA